VNLPLLAGRAERQLAVMSLTVPEMLATKAIVQAVVWAAIITAKAVMVAMVPAQKAQLVPMVM
jgi:hypothetical protein